MQLFSSFDPVCVCVFFSCSDGCFMGLSDRRWVLVFKDVCGRGAGPKPAEACKIHFHSCGGGGGALDLRSSRNVIRSVQHWRRIEAHE